MIYWCCFTYRSIASRTTCESDSPRSAATVFAASQSSVGTRIARSGMRPSLGIDCRSEACEVVGIDAVVGLHCGQPFGSEPSVDFKSDFGSFHALAELHLLVAVHRLASQLVYTDDNTSVYTMQVHFERKLAVA